MFEIWVATLMSLSGAQAHAQPTFLEVYDTIERLEELRGHATPTGCYLDEPANRLDADPFAGSRPRCPLTVETWCEASQKSCNTRYGSKTCTVDICADEFNTDAYPQCLAARKTLERRMASPEVQRDSLAYAAKVFYRTVQDPAMADKCCAGAANNDAAADGCRAKLANAKLRIVEGADLHDSTGNAKGGNVQFSRAILVKHRTRGAMEHGILHEIGHLCQYARHARDQFAANYFAGADLPGLDVHNAKDYADVWGPNMKGCIATAQNISGTDSRRVAWSSEAFADVFAHAFNPSKNLMPEFFGGMCGEGSGVLHGPSRPVMECILRYNTDVQNLCPRIRPR